MNSLCLSLKHPHQQAESKAVINLENAVNLSHLPPALLSRIFQFLSINNLQRTACVCKNWQVVASDDALRKMVLAKILHGTGWESSHEVIAAYNIEHIGEAQFVFLGENHSFRDSRINSAVINEIAGGANIALFIEGSTAMKVIDSSGREAAKKNLSINDDVMNNIQIFGWDMDEATFEQSRLAVWEFERDGEKGLPQNKVKVLNVSIKECQSIVASLAPELSTDALSQDFYADIDDTVLMQVLFKLSGENYESFMSNIQRLMELVKCRQSQHLEDTMPERTQSATLTVRTAAQLQKEGRLPQKAVFVKGKAHLKEGLALHNPQSKAWSLESFYQEIAKHKAVILFPI